MIDFRGLTSLRRVLCIGAHSDDIEIGAGATVLHILKHSPAVEMNWVCFSGNDQRHAEARASFDLFTAGHQVKKSLTLHGFRDAHFPSQLNDIKQKFDELKPIDPDLILTHARDDRHQDHRVINELTWNAFRSHQIWEYEIPKWDGDLGRPNLYVPVDAATVDRKLSSLMSAFGTQRAKHWFDEETFRGLMRIRGLESNTRYAEAFYARKFVVGS
jgi:LmbE family N-acetylglucosaminyl deacetylase